MLPNNNSENDESYLFEFSSGGLTPLETPIGRLVRLLVVGAYDANCDQVSIDCRDDLCAVHYLRGDEMLPRDSMPVRLFVPVKDHIAHLCGVGDMAAGGSYSFAVSEDRLTLRVLVATAESSLGLRLVKC